MYKNRALPAIAGVMLGWVGLRAAILLTTVYNAPPITLRSNLARQLSSVKSTLQIGRESARTPFVFSQKVSIAKYSKPKDGDHLFAAKFNKQQLATSEKIISYAAELGDINIVTPARFYSPPVQNISVVPRPAQISALSASTWVFIRATKAINPLAPNGQLGGSQAGFRIQYPLLHLGGNVFRASIRASGPIAQAQGKEVALGFALRNSSKIPVELILERRIALDSGGRDAFALIVATGYDDWQLTPRTTISTYGQAGVVGLKNRNGFFDGALRVEHAVINQPQRSFRIGVGVWGAAQPHVERIDFGPLIVARQRLGRANVRLSFEYRWRILGRASPNSGPAISIGSDF